MNTIKNQKNNLHTDCSKCSKKVKFDSRNTTFIIMYRIAIKDFYIIYDIH